MSWVIQANERERDKGWADIGILSFAHIFNIGRSHFEKLEFIYLFNYVHLWT